MRTVGLFEAKQKLSELVDRAQEGERIGIRGIPTALWIVVRQQRGTSGTATAISDGRN
jgi:antitoxin (DNA-binding transcriptional repressor) of toxin-antitoxin stability system